MKQQSEQNQQTRARPEKQ